MNTDQNLSSSLLSVCIRVHLWFLLTYFARAANNCSRIARNWFFTHASIIGGIILRVQDQLIDASVKNQLRAMREQLLAARAK